MLNSNLPNIDPFSSGTVHVPTKDLRRPHNSLNKGPTGRGRTPSKATGTAQEHDKEHAQFSTPSTASPPVSVSASASVPKSVHVKHLPGSLGLCPAWEYKGTCSRGADCWYKHGLGDLSQVCGFPLSLKFCSQF